MTIKENYVILLFVKEEKPRLPLKSHNMANRLEENRQFFRVKLQAPLRYQIRGKPEFNNTIVNNISLGGLSFTNSGFIPPDTLLMLQVNVLSRMLNPIGKIAWANSLPRSDRYQFGVEFMEMDELEKKHLADYVNMKNASMI